jgi:predicted secreted protein
MSDVSNLKIDGTSYSLKDATAQSKIATLESSLDNYLPLSGGTLTGNIQFSNSTQTVLYGTTPRGIYATIADNDGWRIVGYGSSNSGALEIATADDGTEPIYVRQYSGGGGGTGYNTIARTATLLDESGNTSFPGTVSATFKGNLTGTASNAGAVGNWSQSNLVWSGYITSGTSGLSSYWFPIWKFTSYNEPCNDKTLTFLFDSKFSPSFSGIVTVGIRMNGAKDSTTRNIEGSLTVLIQRSTSSNKLSDCLKLFINNTTGDVQLWGNVCGQYGVMNYTVLKKTSRTSKDESSIGTLTASIFEEVQTQPSTDSYSVYGATVVGYVAGANYADTCGKADHATKLSTARMIKLGGDATGSANFDGSANITITADVKKSAALDSTNVGSSTVPVYFDSNGQPVAITSYSGNSATATSAITAAKLIDSGDNFSNITLNYSGSALAYADYVYLAVWDGYELRKVEKSQFVASTDSRLTDSRKASDVYDWAKKANLSLAINTLSTGSSTPTDNDYYICQYAGGGTSTTTYHRRPTSALYTYMKGKFATVAATGSYSDLSNKPNILLLNNAASWTWGTLTTANGYTQLGSNNESGGGSFALAAKSGQTSVQIDGRFYDQEGQYRLVDTNDLTTTLSSYAKTSSIGDGTLTIQAEGTTKGTFTANQSDASTINLKASDFGLSSALKFLGTSSTEITEGSTTSKITLTDGTTVTATTGNVVLYGHKEFIWNAAWEELGDESSHALKSVTITGTGALSGGGSLEANRTITHNTTTRTNNTSSASPAVGGTFTAIDSVTSDSYGHITAVNTKTVTMPYDTSKLPLTGGAIKTNNITTSAGLATVSGLSRAANTMQLGANGIVIVSPTTVNDCAWIRLTSSANESEELEIATGNDGSTDFNVHFRGYNTSNAVDVDIALPKKSGTVALTSDVPSSLKNPNTISFKDTSGTTVSYDGSSALDLTDGLYYAVNADKLDGYHADASATASTVVARDSNGFIYGKYFNSAIDNDDTMSLASVYCSNDNWIRKMAPASFRNTNAVRKWCMVGSDTANTSGYYKVASQTLSGYGDSNVTFMVTSTYGNYMSGILQLQMRSENTAISCKKLGWLTRNGFSDTGAVICVISSMTYTIYAKQSITQYGRIMFEVISESAISSNSSGITLYNSNTPESTTPTATVKDSDIGYVSEASHATSATNVGLSVKGSGTNSITIQAGSATSASFVINNVANASYATSSGTASSATKATQDADGNTISSTYVKKISTSDTKVYANASGTDTSYIITSVNTTPNTLVFRNGSTGYSVINTPADTSTTSTYIANTGWVNTKLNNKADKATTLDGYGITDAKISNGTITLGSNSITPLTSHLTVDSALSSTSTNPVQNKVINSALSGKASTSHTHTTSLASSTGTSSITLSHGGKYQLTTGGTSVIFTMPSDSDTHYTNSLTIQGNGTTATTFSQNANKTLNIVGSGATTVSATTDKITITSTDTNTWRGIQNNLTSTSTTDSLSAAQGKALNEAKVAKSGDTMTGALTLPQASFSGKVYMEYNSTTDSLDTIFN